MMAFTRAERLALKHSWAEARFAVEAATAAAQAIVESTLGNVFMGTFLSCEMSSRGFRAPTRLPPIDMEMPSGRRRREGLSRRLRRRRRNESAGILRTPAPLSDLTAIEAWPRSASDEDQLLFLPAISVASSALMWNRPLRGLPELGPRSAVVIVIRMRLLVKSSATRVSPARSTVTVSD